MALRTLLSSKNYSVTKVIYFIKELTFDNLLASTILSSKRVIFKLKAPQGELREEFVDFSFPFLYPPSIKFPTFFP